MTREQTNIDDLMWRKRLKFDKDLADRMGITPQSLYNKLRGSISMSTIEHIAESLNVTIADVIVKTDKFKFVENPKEQDE